jgi:hypothetical protein
MAPMRGDKLATDEPSERKLSEEYFRTPSSARIWNYWMGGKDNYPIDREAGDAYALTNPGIRVGARESRRFLIRVVHYLAAEARVRQFLDIGTGFPTVQNTHEVAQAVAPESTIVYVDHDPVVLAHARALLVPGGEAGMTSFIDADVHDPSLILSETRRVLRFTEPIGVLFFGVLGHVGDLDTARAIVAEVTDALPPGSYFAHYDGISADPAYAPALAEYPRFPAPYNLRTPGQLAEFYEGLELVDPGVVPVNQWRPRLAVQGGQIEPVSFYGGVGRKS